MRKLLIVSCICFVFSSCGAQTGIALSKNKDGSTTLLSNTTEATSVYISKDGKLGLGKQNTEDKLEVNGQIHARSVKVDLEKWADHVFKKDYDLKELQDIEAYIQTHGHLPEIPAASSVLEEGINLGEMNRLLLQKVEELTLYLIEKDRQLNHLTKRMRGLENEVNTLKEKN